MFPLDINLLWVSKCTYPAKYIIKKNHHDYYQIVFILNGEGKITNGDHVIHASINQAYIFKPNVDHKIEASKYKSLHIIELKFYCNNVTTESLVSRLIPFIKDVGQSMRTSFINFVEEIKNQDDYSLYIINSLLTQLIFGWKRMSAQERNGYNERNGKAIYVNKDSHDNGIKKDPLDSTIEYIRENYSSEIKLNDLAEIAYLSPIYFCSAFKERYGISPIQYLQNIRCENAKKLLIDSDDTITIISERVGFQSIHYFSRYFKSREGITPNEFRRRNREFFIIDYQGNITDYS